MSLTDIAAFVGIVWLVELVALPLLLLHMQRQERRERQAPTRSRRALPVADDAQASAPPTRG